MEIKIINENDNPSLNRKEIIIEIEHIKEITPSRKEIKDKLKAMKDYNPKLTVIKELKTNYGIGRSKALIFIYESREILEKIEPKYLINRDEEESGEANNN